MPAMSPAVPWEQGKIFSAVISHTVQQPERGPVHALNTEVNPAWQELFEIKASRQHLTAWGERFLRGDLFLSTFPAMELVSIRPQLASSASRWQRQKEISGQTASASLLLWRQPLYQSKSSHLSPAPSEAMQQIAEETLREVGPGGQGSSSRAQKAKPDPLPTAPGGSPWAGKGDERVTTAISAPGMGSDTLTGPCCPVPSGLLLLLLRRRGAAPKPCMGAPRGLLEGRLLRDTQGFACFACWAWPPKSFHFLFFFFICQMSILWAKILYSS